ncbi:MAG: hypothetical protein K2K20_04870 [Lachnospiraceae bacterium]|nr:hypothetical protein [Lachnospiraceae bacterium]
MKEKTPKIIWSRSNGSMFERFAINLEEYTMTGEAPKGGDQDIRYALKLQKERLQNKRISMQYSFTPRGHFADKDLDCRRWSDAHYTSQMKCRTCAMERTIIRNGKKEYTNRKNMSFYQTITDVNTPQLAKNATYNCPSCGGVSTIAQLQTGCPYCGTCFRMSDIFPVVSNYYFLEDMGLTEEEYKAKLAKFMVVAGILFFFFMLFKYLFFDGIPEGGPVSFLFTLLLTSVFGGVTMGWLLYTYSLLGKLIWESGRTMPMLPSLGSGWRFFNLMKRYSPEFSYEYFSNKVISLLKAIIFTDNLSELAIYEGAPLDGMFDDVIDVFYAGGMGLKNFRIKGDFCFVTVTVFLDNLYDNGEKIYQRRNKYSIQVKRNLNRPINMHFSIQRLQCKNCGASFDATKEKHCPSCGSAYHLEYEDWVVTQIKKLIY